MHTCQFLVVLLVNNLDRNLYTQQKNKQLISLFFRSTVAQSVWACLIGTATWAMIRSDRVTIRTIQLPLVVQDASLRNGNIVPPSATITIGGPRRALLAFLATAPTIEVDLSTYDPGLVPLKITPEQLHLPSSLQLLSYSTLYIYHAYLEFSGL